MPWTERPIFVGALSLPGSRPPQSVPSRVGFVRQSPPESPLASASWPFLLGPTDAAQFKAHPLLPGLMQ